jgi:transcriptional regulator with XRE-family HTH domain
MIYASMRSGKLLRSTRLEAGLTQAELARRASTTQNAVSRIERGAVEPTIPTLERLLHAMGMQLRVDVTSLPSGNARPRDLRAEFEATTPEQRVAEAMALSEFLTGLAAAATRDGEKHGSR